MKHIFRSILMIFATAASALSLAVATPTPILSERDVARYQTIFAAQEKGHWKTADKQIGALKNRILLGYVLEQRYMHPTAYRSTYPELSRWLTAYADHPNAARIYRLAKARRSGRIPPQRPSGRQWRTETSAAMHPTLAADYQKNGSKIRLIERRLRQLTQKLKARQALAYLNHPKQNNKLTVAQTDRARGWIAAAYYYQGELKKADQVASLAINRSSDSAVLSHWIAGLIAWRQGDMDRAYTHFSTQANIPYQDPSLRAAGAYWANRAAIANGDMENVLTYLYVAADHPLTFYGQLALSQLGLDPGIDWSVPEISDTDVTRISKQNPRIKRAMALAQVGLIEDADIELKWAQGEIKPAEDYVLMGIAHEYGLASAQLTIAHYAGVQDFPHGGMTSGFYPLPDYRPNNGFKIDQALLFGLIRQESKFNPSATSKAGAKGLMQLMPRTASYIAGTATSSKKLHDPGYNMQLGQSYVQQLLTRYNDKSGDLFEMTLSYNWGPGNFSRWKAKTDISDQLLMLESVPNAEARHFVETVLTNIWVYRNRLGEPAPSREKVATGQRPIYQSLQTSTNDASR